MKAAAKIELEVPVNQHSLIYLLSGKIKVEGFGIVEALNAVTFELEGADIHIEALEESKMLFLTGEEIPEKKVSQGPFVMNSETEIMQAYRDYQMGRMGVLIEE
jgi:redox-sensitive bicupin YhaK (pirin superfamily)